MKYNNDFSKYLAVVIDFIFDLYLLCCCLTPTRALLFTNYLLLFRYVFIVLTQRLLDLVKIYTFSLHVIIISIQSLVNKDDEVCQALYLYVIFLLKFVNNIVHLCTIVFQILFLYLFQSNFCSLLYFYLLELLFFTHQ